MKQQQLSELLYHNRIVKITFADDDPDNLEISSIELEDGHVISVSGEVLVSHLQKAKEIDGFYRALANIPSSGKISFQAKYLSKSLIEEEIKKKAKELKANGWGPVQENRVGYQAFRFDMPE